MIPAGLRSGLGKIAIPNNPCIWYIYLHEHQILPLQTTKCRDQYILHGWYGYDVGGETRFSDRNRLKKFVGFSDQLAKAPVELLLMVLQNAAAEVVLILGSQQK